MQLNRDLFTVICTNIYKSRRTSLFGNGVSGIGISISNSNSISKQFYSQHSAHNQFNKSTSDCSESRELVRRIYNLARSGQTSVEAWRDCTIKTIDQMDRLDLKGVCSILHSYGYMKYRDRNMLEMVSAKLIQNIRVINSSQIVNVLRAYSILKFRSDFLFRLMIPEISLRMDMMNVNQVSSIFYSYSNLGYYNKNLFQSIQSFLYNNIDSIKPYDLTLLLNGYCKNFRGFDQRFLTVLSFQFCKLLDSYDNKLFSLTVNSLSRINFCNHKYLPSLIESEVYNRLKLTSQPMQSKSLSLLMNALSRHYDSCTPLFTFLSQTVLKRLKEFDLHSICLVLSAFSRVSLLDGKTYDKIAEYIGRNSLKLYPRAIASMLYSYSQAKHLHGSLFYFSGKHLELNISNYSCDEVGMILRAFTVLNVKNEDLLRSVSEFIVRNTPDYVPMKFEDLCLEDRITLSSLNISEKDRTKLDREDKEEQDNRDKNREVIKDTKVDEEEEETLKTNEMNNNNKNKTNKERENENGETKIEEIYKKYMSKDKDNKKVEQYNSEKEKLKDNEAEEIEGLNINLLEYIGETTKVHSNYLSNGKIHSLLWIVEAYSKFYFVNDQVFKSINRIANEIVVRMNELTPFLVSRLIYSFSQLNFRHKTCLEMLLNEVMNPRSNFIYNQKELSLIHYSISSFGMEASSIGVYKFNRYDYQSMVEKYNTSNNNKDNKENISNDGNNNSTTSSITKSNTTTSTNNSNNDNDLSKELRSSSSKLDSNSILELIGRIVEQDIPSPSKPMYLELLTNPLKYEEYNEEQDNRDKDRDKYNEATEEDREDKEELDTRDKDEDEEDVIYVHIPKYAKELVRLHGYGSDLGKNGKLSDEIEGALNKHINYNFNID